MFGPLLEVDMLKKCRVLWREAHFQVKMLKTHVRTTFRSWHVEKVHAVVARSTFPCQNGNSTTCSDHFLTVRCRKSARCCGAKHIWKSKAQKKNWGFWAFYDAQMSKKGILTNLTNLANWTYFIYFTYSTTLSHLTNLTNLDNLTNLTNWANLTNQLTN